MTVQENSSESVQTLPEGSPYTTGQASDSFGEGIEIDSSNSESQGCSSSTCDATDSPADKPQPCEAKPNELLGKLPPEIAMLLVVAGVAGVLLPGPVGMPLLIAGGVTLWPRTFQPIERWFSRRFPSVHREGVFQIKEFLTDLEKRYPQQEKIDSL